MGRRYYIIRRFTLALVSVFVVSTLMFVLFRLLPSDPTAYVIGPGMDPEVQENLRRQYGLEQPLYVQYLRYIANIATFDLGQSFFLNEPVSDILVRRTTNTFVLMGTAMFFGFSIGTTFGAAAAWRAGRFERYTLVAFIVFRSIPEFIAGLLILWIFGFELQWLPVGHMTDSSVVFDSRLDMFLSWNFVKHLVLPVASIVPFTSAFPFLLMRITMLEVVDEDFITMSRAKGLTEYRVFLNHAVRNSLLPIFTSMPIVIGVAVTGNIVIETIFSWPGLGRTIVEATSRGDFPLLQGAFLMIALIVIFGNFLVDITYGWFDPRITLE